MEIMQALEKEAFISLQAMAKITENGDSAVERFYAGCNIFITGGSGFMGKQLIEKLFRSCSVRKIYLLLRSKKGKNAQQRIDAILQDPVFDHLHREKPGFIENIIAVEGDVSEIRLGLSEFDWTVVTEQVNVIFHGAATVNFKEPIKTATLINVRGTREILRLAKSCKNLRSVVHVSTAYSHATKSRVSSIVKEKFYDCPMPPDAMIEMAEKMDDEKLTGMMRIPMEDWPNTYTFSKALGEDLVRSNAQNLPICIVRPSIVIGSYREPLPGWVDSTSVFGINGVILGMLIGVIHTFQIHRDIIFSIVPVDVVINTMITAGWETTKQQIHDDNINIYNVTNNRSPLLLREMTKVLNTDVRNFLPQRAIWYSFVIETPYKATYLLWTLLTHFIPAFFVDNACRLINKRPKLLNIYKKVYNMSVTLNYFTNNEWDFKDDNTLNLYNNLSKNDQFVFSCDMGTVDCKKMVKIWALGICKYIAKDDFKNTKQVMKKQFWLKLLTYCIFCLYVYIFYRILSFCF